ncbi:MAG: FHA domain-containing protein [Chloroflexota bacterium]|nr:FHA domain-containing protein [Chloroflexota bacterium]
MTENAPYLVDCAGRRFPFASPVVTLGRSHDCDVHVPDKRASRRHAEINWDGEASTLRDLDSANGTFLNGRRITISQTLRDGDEIVIASAVFTFRDPEATIRVAEFPILVVDQDSGEIWVDRTPVSLSLKERALFDLLHSNTGRVCSKQEIAGAVWPEYQAEVYDYQIESLVKRLREKLEPDPRAPVLVVTVRGQGYKLAIIVSRTLA